MRQLDAILGPLQGVIPFGAIIGLGLVLVGTHVARARRHSGRPYWQPAILAVMGLIGLLGGVVLDGILEGAADEEIEGTLAGDLEAITVDRVPLDGGADLFAALKDMHRHHAPSDHGPNLPHTYVVSIETSTGHLTLYLRRNGSHPAEYRVVYPGYQATLRGAAVGEIGTHALDGIT